MIIHDVVQGTWDWMQLRLGIPTASQFDRLITPKTLKPSSAQAIYRADLLAEWLLGHPLEWGSNGWVERGAWLEEEALTFYEMNQNVDVRKVGFISSDDGLCGGSPDGLVGEDGGVEIKVPSASMHMRYVLGLEPDYVGQCQGYMHLTGRKWWDLLSYSPTLPPVIYRVERNEAYQTALAPILRDFSRLVEQDKHRLYLYRTSGPDSEYAPIEDDELEQFHRELVNCQAEQVISDEEAQQALAYALDGRWRDIRRFRDTMRSRVIEGIRYQPRLVRDEPAAPAAQPDLGL